MRSDLYIVSAGSGRMWTLFSRIRIRPCISRLEWWKGFLQNYCFVPLNLLMLRKLNSIDLGQLSIGQRKICSRIQIPHGFPTPSRTFRISAAWQNIRLCKEVVQMFGTSILYHNCEIKHNCSKMYSKLRCFFRNVVFGAPAHGNTSKFLAVFAWWDNMYCSGKFCQTVPKVFVLSTHWTLQISEFKKKKIWGGVALY